MKDGAPSLRRRLTVSIVCILGLSLAGSSLVVYVAFTRAIWSQFDARLAQDAQAIALMVEEYDGRPWEIEPGAFELLARTRGPERVQLWLDDGSVLARSPLATEDLPRPALSRGPSFADIRLADGRPGRLHQTWLQARPGEGVPPERLSGRKIGIAVARDTDDVLSTIGIFRVLLWGPTLAVIALAALAASVAIQGMLARTARLSESIAALDASTLGDRLQLRGLPVELRPPFVKVNELLSRLERSFARERQFTADVTHELRTPLAGLHSVLEVSASRLRPAAHHRESLGEALAIVRQMEGTVESLLMLARLDSSRWSALQEDVALRDLVDACFARYTTRARERELRFENRVPPELLLRSDRDKLALVIANLLSNATEYTAQGGWIAVESGPGRHAVVTVRDSGPPIPDEALERLFDPFFRLDPARSGGGEHVGIGLALVRRLCTALGYRVAASNEPDGVVAFTVSPASPASDAVEPSTTWVTAP